MPEALACSGAAGDLIVNVQDLESGCQVSPAWTA